jgi:hypothetical protein
MNRQHRILFIVKKRSYEGENSIPVGVYYSALFLTNALAKDGVIAKTALIDSNDEISPIVNDFKPTHVSIQALVVDPKKLSELCRLFPQVLWNVRLHSKVPFLATDRFAFEYINGYMNEIIPFLPNFQITTNNKKTSKDLSEVLKTNIPYLPNIYLPKAMPDLTTANYPLPKPKKDEKNRDLIDIGCFGAPRTLKNHLHQAMSALRFAAEQDKVIHFHVNSPEAQSIEQQNIVKNLRDLFATQKNHQLFEHDWVDHENFIALVRKMDLGMQVSLSETFNFVTADFVSSEIPIIVSPEVDWMPESFQANPFETADILKTMSIALRGRFLHFQNICKKALFRENSVNEEWWESYFKQPAPSNFGG